MPDDSELRMGFGTLAHISTILECIRLGAERDFRVEHHTLSDSREGHLRKMAQMEGDRKILYHPNLSEYLAACIEYGKIKGFDFENPFAGK